MVVEFVRDCGRWRGGRRGHRSVLVVVKGSLTLLRRSRVLVNRSYRSAFTYLNIISNVILAIDRKVLKIRLR